MKSLTDPTNKTLEEIRQRKNLFQFGAGLLCAGNHKSTPPPLGHHFMNGFKKNKLASVRPYFWYTLSRIYIVLALDSRVQ